MPQFFVNTWLSQTEADRPSWQLFWCCRCPPLLAVQRGDRSPRSSDSPKPTPLTPCLNHSTPARLSPPARVPIPLLSGHRDRRAMNALPDSPRVRQPLLQIGLSHQGRDGSAVAAFLQCKTDSRQTRGMPSCDLGQGNHLNLHQGIEGQA